LSELLLSTSVYDADPEDPQIQKALEIHRRRRPLEEGEVREHLRLEWIELVYGIEDVDELALAIVVKRLPMISSGVRRR